jgi:predicted methyltransferase
MPASCCTTDYDTIFDERAARRQLESYLRLGARGSTRRMIEALKAAGAAGASVLDIGGGVGIIGLELLRAGAESLTDVEASRPYLAVAREAADSAGLAGHTRFLQGDFVQLAREVEPADVVTLDRVVCCYGDWRALVDASASHARRLYGMVYPNERWWLRVGIGLGNLVLRAAGRSFRGHIHPERKIDERVRRAGFRVRSHHRGLVWQTVLYERIATA